MVIYQQRLMEFLIQGEAKQRICRQLELHRYLHQPLQFVPIIILQCVDLSQLISLPKTSFLSAQYEKDFFKRNINYSLPLHFQVLHDSMQKPFFMSIQSRKGISTYVYQCNCVLQILCSTRCIHIVCMRLSTFSNFRFLFILIFHKFDQYIFFFLFIFFPLFIYK